MNIAIRCFLVLTIFLFAAMLINAQAERLAKMRETYVKELKDDGIVGSSFWFELAAAQVVAFEVLEKRAALLAYERAENSLG